jgi:hypothetical protein
MKEISIFSFIHLGALHWHLARFLGKPDIRGENGVLPALKDFKQQLENAGLPVTIRAGWKLWKLADEIEKDDKLVELTPEMVRNINKYADSIETTLVAESEGKIVFLITDKRLDIEKLLHNPTALLLILLTCFLLFVSVISQPHANL